MSASVTFNPISPPPMITALFMRLSFMYFCNFSASDNLINVNTPLRLTPFISGIIGFPPVEISNLS